MLQTDYARGTKDSDFVRTGEVAPEVEQRLLSLAGPRRGSSSSIVCTSSLSTAGCYSGVRQSTARHRLTWSDSNRSRTPTPGQLSCAPAGERIGCDSTEESASSMTSVVPDSVVEQRELPSRSRALRADDPSVRAVWCWRRWTVDATARDPGPSGIEMVRALRASLCTRERSLARPASLISEREPVSRSLAEKALHGRCRREAGAWRGPFDGFRPAPTAKDLLLRDPVDTGIGVREVASTAVPTPIPQGPARRPSPRGKGEKILRER